MDKGNCSIPFKPKKGEDINKALSYRGTFPEAEEVILKAE